eukprot:TRINITY_DN42022_c0_g1_i1.p1 TRINITY_DN42022_c0_g1~~TRINITY_DN42022_c0_g1_i1.p1  ORF type:complete len:400 (+),score=62.90 TRINITY_DN42022_c0_g1_i1:51-1250(+)
MKPSATGLPRAPGGNQQAAKRRPTMPGRWDGRPGPGASKASSSLQGGPKRVRASDVFKLEADETRHGKAEAPQRDPHSHSSEHTGRPWVPKRKDDVRMRALALLSISKFDTVRQRAERLISADATLTDVPSMSSSRQVSIGCPEGDSTTAADRSTAAVDTHAEEASQSHTEVGDAHLRETSAEAKCTGSLPDNNCQADPTPEAEHRKDEAIPGSDLPPSQPGTDSSGAPGKRKGAICLDCLSILLRGTCHCGKCICTECLPALLYNPGTYLTSAKKNCVQSCVSYCCGERPLPKERRRMRPQDLRRRMRPQDRRCDSTAAKPASTLALTDSSLPSAPGAPLLQENVPAPMPPALHAESAAPATQAPSTGGQKLLDELSALEALLAKEVGSVAALHASTK